MARSGEGRRGAAGDGDRPPRILPRRARRAVADRARGSVLRKRGAGTRDHVSHRRGLNPHGRFRPEMYGRIHHIESTAKMVVIHAHRSRTLGVRATEHRSLGISGATRVAVCTADGSRGRNSVRRRPRRGAGCGKVHRASAGDCVLSDWHARVGGPAGAAPAWLRRAPRLLRRLGTTVCARVPRAKYSA